MTTPPDHDRVTRDARAVDARLLGELTRPLALVRPHGLPWLASLLAMSEAARRLFPLMTAWLARWQSVLEYETGDSTLVHARWRSESDATAAGSEDFSPPSPAPSATPSPASPTHLPARPVVRASAPSVRTVHSQRLVAAPTRRATSTASPGINSPGANPPAPPASQTARPSPASTTETVRRLTIEPGAAGTFGSPPPEASPSSATADATRSTAPAAHSATAHTATATPLPPLAHPAPERAAITELSAPSKAADRTMQGAGRTTVVEPGTHAAARAPNPAETPTGRRAVVAARGTTTRRPDGQTVSGVTMPTEANVAALLHRARLRGMNPPPAAPATAATRLPASAASALASAAPGTAAPEDSPAARATTPSAEAAPPVAAGQPAPAPAPPTRRHPAPALPGSRASAADGAAQPTAAQSSGDPLAQSHAADAQAAPLASVDASAPRPSTNPHPVARARTVAADRPAGPAYTARPSATRSRVTQPSAARPIIASPNADQPSADHLSAAHPSATHPSADARPTVTAHRAARAPRPAVVTQPPVANEARPAAPRPAAPHGMMHPTPPAPQQAVPTPKTVEDARRLLGLADQPAAPPTPEPSAPAAPRPLSPREVHTIADVVQHRVLRQLERERNRTRTRL